ncbi:hypothetical protein [Mesorhizobium sp. M0244]|uniref:hypothetical protein n=1 Tax=Mesorhizobium sp. M0244 TaxID=2956926 RepID=UPI00333DF1D2
MPIPKISKMYLSVTQISGLPVDFFGHSQIIAQGSACHFYETEVQPSNGFFSDSRVYMDGIREFGSSTNPMILHDAAVDKRPWASAPTWPMRLDRMRRRPVALSATEFRQPRRAAEKSASPLPVLLLNR